MRSIRKLGQPLALMAALLLMSLGTMGCGGPDCEGVCDDAAALCDRLERCESEEIPGEVFELCSEIGDEGVAECKAGCGEASDDEVEAVESLIELANNALSQIGC